ncbi:hypothetical protein ACX0MV_12855 [Pseudomonas borbori]
MKSVISIPALFGMAALLVSLAGCDAAEQSAQKLAEKAEQAVQEVAREAISDTVKELNKQVDQIQQSTDELLGKPEQEQQPKPSEQAEQTTPGTENDLSAQDSIET